MNDAMAYVRLLFPRLHRAARFVRPPVSGGTPYRLVFRGRYKQVVLFSHRMRSAYRRFHVVHGRIKRSSETRAEQYVKGWRYRWQFR